MRSDIAGLGQRLRDLRRVRGFTQAQLAECIGVRVMTVSQWETGASLPAAPRLGDLAKALGVPSDFLLFGHASNVRRTKDGGNDR
ncbi:MAG: helix-turn-helix transcriptional regulator [Myxococcota bacterium]